jgi:uncharacterized protein YrrD
MPTITDMESRRVYNADGASLGRVSAVLFHPATPRVVGIEIAPDPYQGIVSRKPRYALLDDLELVGEGGIRLPAKKLPRDEAGERTLGYSWQDTVVWHRMPVRSDGGDEVGVVSDAAFDAATGEVERIGISTGLVGDAAIGKLAVGREHLRGFDGEAIVVLPGYASIDAGGGMAKHAAVGVVTAKVRGEQAADAAIKATAAAAVAVKRSFKSGLGRAAVDGSRRALDKLQAMIDEGDEE